MVNNQFVLKYYLVFLIYKPTFFLPRFLVTALFGIHLPSILSYNAAYKAVCWAQSISSNQYFLVVHKKSLWQI